MNHQSPGAGSPDRNRALAAILGDFGRMAALRFAASLADEERLRILDQLGDGAAFFDEHRRITLSLVGDLPYAKEPFLAGRDRPSDPLDETILVGFPGGPTTDDLVPRLGVLALEAMSGPLRRGMREVLVLSPCNTLAPVSWELADAFADAEGIEQLLVAAGAENRSDLRELIPILADECAVRFPTVPEAALSHASAAGAAAVLPLGTVHIADIYTEAARRLGSPVRVMAPTDAEHRVVLTAITDAIDGSPAAHAESARALAAVVESAREHCDVALEAVAACTDLDYGVGLDSERLYAQRVVQHVYG